MDTVEIAASLKGVSAYACEAGSENERAGEARAAVEMSVVEQSLTLARASLSRMLQYRNRF